MDAGSETALSRISLAQHHRGPDDEGGWKAIDDAEGYGASFAFRRLSIIDLSPDGHQPMVDPETGNVIVFNGELYNYRDLRVELSADGFQFRSQSDTEVLLKAYAKWGLSALARLRGMYAFAIWDKNRRQVVMARDRLGIKPLYFCTNSTSANKRTVYFASELRSLLVGGIVERKLNASAVASYVWNGFVIGPQTIVQGIELLAPGNFAIVKLDGSLEPHSYWQLPRYAPERDGIDRLRHALETSVQQHLVSDVPLGVFLSGGIDSSAVTALAVRSAGSGIRTFNLSFDESQYDESEYARSVAIALGTDHTEVRLSREMFQTQIESALGSIDQPTFDAINSYFISRAVREAGMTVALAGTGGDELFGGYNSFVDIPRARRATLALGFLPQWAMSGITNYSHPRARNGDNRVPSQTRWGKLGDILRTRGDVVALYQTMYALFTTDYVQELLGGHFPELETHGLPSSRALQLRQSVSEDEILNSISSLELANFIGERLLRDTDAASMGVSLEARVPLLDHEIVEAAARVETSRRYSPLGRKQLLRTLSLSALPAEMFDRPKQGFGLPMNEWCRAVLKDQMDVTFEDPEACASVGLNHHAVWQLWEAFKAGKRGIYWSRVWSIFVLLRWCRTHGVSS